MIKALRAYFENMKELLVLLRSIDKRLEKLERCVAEGSPSHSRGGRLRLITGHWNESGGY